MLTEKELAEALIVNLMNWDWDINSKFGIDKKTGDALVEEYHRLKGYEPKVDFDCALRD